MMSELTAKSRPAADDTPEFRVALDETVTLPSRKPLTSWAELETSAVVESPADDLFGTGTGAGAGTSGEKKSRFRSSLGAAFAEFEAVAEEPAEPAALAEPAAPAEPVAEPAPTYDEPIGPPPKPADNETPRRERSAATIASLLTEALAAYQSGTEEAEPTPPTTLDPFDSFLRDSARGTTDSGLRGRHRTPE